MSDMHLLTPGPVHIPPFVMEAIIQPVIPHRSSAFEDFYGNLLKDLAWLFQSSGTILCLNGSGTQAVEMAIESLFRKKEKILLVNNGKFSQRWVDFSKILGLEVIELQKPWGEVCTIEDIVKKVREHRNLKGVVLTHCETSTGVLLDLEEIAYAVKQEIPEILLMVDAITTVGCLPFYFDQWQIDCAICASQKALMNPVGLGFVALSQRSLDHLFQTHAADHRNLFNYVDFAHRNSYPFSPAVNLLYGVQAALDHMKKCGLAQVWNQTYTSWQTFQKGLKELGGKNLAESLSPSLSAFYFEEKDNDMIRKQLERDFTIYVSNGQAAQKGKIMRISHMGTSDSTQMHIALGALQEILKN